MPLRTLRVNLRACGQFLTLDVDTAVAFGLVGVALPSLVQKAGVDGPTASHENGCSHVCTCNVAKTPVKRAANGVHSLLTTDCIF